MLTDSIWRYRGFFRLHFNRPDEAPRFASITGSDHSWEVICTTVQIRGAVNLWSNHDMKAPTYSPKWWLEGWGYIEVDNHGCAIIREQGYGDISKTPGC